MAVNPLGMITLIAEYLIIIAFIFSAIMFARGKSAEGWNWFKNAVALALALVIIPAAVSFIFTGNDNPSNAIKNVNVPAYYVDIDTGLPNTTVVKTISSDETYYGYGYLYAFSTKFNIVGMNFGNTQGDSNTLLFGNNGEEFTIPAGGSPFISIIGAKKISNKGVNSGLDVSIKFDNFLTQKGIVEIDYSADNTARAGEITVYVGYVSSGVSTDTVNNATATTTTTVTLKTYLIKYVVYASPVKVSGGGGGLSGAIASAFSGIINKIIAGFKWIGEKAVEAVPSIDGRRAMIMFVFLPTERMLSTRSDFIHDFYYSKALPIGMTLLVMTTILAFIEQLWNGSNDAVFTVMKRFTGVVIWMIGGYYFYMAFAEFVDGTILAIGVHGLLWFGSLINSLFGMIIVLGIATMLVSNNVSGTALGMVMGILYLFYSMAIFRFFFIAAAVAMFPIIAPFSMIGYGPSMNTVISKMVEQGITGILITAAIEFLRLSQNAGGLLASVTSIVVVYILFSPQQIHSILGGIATGEHMGIGSSMSMAGSAMGAATGLTRMTATGVGETATGIYSKAKKTKLSSDRPQQGVRRVSVVTRKVRSAFSRNRSSTSTQTTPQTSKPTTVMEGKSIESVTKPTSSVEQSAKEKAKTTTKGTETTSEETEKPVSTAEGLETATEGVETAQEAGEVTSEETEKPVSTAEETESIKENVKEKEVTEKAVSTAEAEIKKTEEEKEEEEEIKKRFSERFKELEEHGKEITTKEGEKVIHPIAALGFSEQVKRLEEAKDVGALDALIKKKVLGEKAAAEYKERMKRHNTVLSRLHQVAKGFESGAGARSTFHAPITGLRNRYLEEMANTYKGIAEEATNELEGLKADLYKAALTSVEKVRRGDVDLTKALGENINMSEPFEKAITEFLTKFESELAEIEETHSNILSKIPDMKADIEEELYHGSLQLSPERNIKKKDVVKEIRRIRQELQRYIE